MALNLYGQPDDQSAYGAPMSLDQLLAVQPLTFNPPAAPNLPAPPALGGAPAPGADRIAGNQEVLGHLQTVMQAAAQGQLGGSSSAPKGLVKAGETVKTTDDGLSPGQRATGAAVRGQADLDAGQVAADRQAEIAHEAHSHAVKLQVEAAAEDQQRAKAEEENQQREQRIREHQEALAEQRDEPVNPNRYFENMSLFGKAAAVISAFSYGYLNPKNQGIAPIMQTLTQMASEDTRAQIANNQEGRARRGDLIALYERRYGDASLVQKKLEADKLQTLGKKALADAEESKSAQAKAAAQDLAKNLLIKGNVLNQQVDEAYARQPVERTTTYKPAAGKDGAAGNYVKWAAADKALEAQGVARDDAPRVALRAHFGITASKNTAAEQTDSEQAAAAAEKRQAKADKFEQLSPEEKKDARNKIDGLADVVDTLDSMAKAGGIQRGVDGSFTPEGSKLGKLTGAGQIVQDASQHAPLHVGEGVAQALAAVSPKEANDLRRNRDTIAAGLAKAEFARTTEFEFNNEQARLPMGNPTDFVSGMNYAETKARSHYRNAVGQYGEERVDRELRERGVDPQRFKEPEQTKVDPATRSMIQDDIEAAYRKQGRRGP